MNLSVDRPNRALGALREAGLLLGLVLFVPVAIIVLGAPIALLVRLVITLFN
jgi:hypothetical protein